MDCLFVYKRGQIYYSYFKNKATNAIFYGSAFSLLGCGNYNTSATIKLLPVTRITSVGSAAVFAACSAALGVS